MAAISDAQSTGGGNPDAASYGGTGGQTTGASSYSYQDTPIKESVPVIQSGPTLAEQVAANLAALGYVGSPLGTQPQQPVIVQAPTSNNMLWILVILAVAGLAFWYMKKHGEL
jgi:hypothetical protein